MRVLNQSYELVAPSRLRQHPRNPNVGNINAIGESIDRNGFFGAVVAQISTGYILAGNHRFIAALQSRAKEIPVIWVDVDEAEAMRIMLADNRLAEIAERDQDLLLTLLSELAQGDMVHGLDGTGYSNEDLDRLIQDLAQPGEGEPPAGEPATVNSVPAPLMLKWPGGEIAILDSEVERLSWLLLKYHEKPGNGGFVTWITKGCKV